MEFRKLVYLLTFIFYKCIVYEPLGDYLVMMIYVTYTCYTYHLLLTTVALKCIYLFLFCFV